VCLDLLIETQQRLLVRVRNRGIDAPVRSAPRSEESWAVPWLIKVRCN